MFLKLLKIEVLICEIVSFFHVLFGLFSSCYDHDVCFFRLAISGSTTNHTVLSGEGSNSCHKTRKEGSLLGWSRQDRRRSSCIRPGLPYCFSGFKELSID